MTITSTNADLYLSTLKEKQAQPKDQTSMGKDQFLKLLIAQLSNQDPSNPMEDKEFIAQMASFSTLEQMTNMSTAFEKYASVTEQTQLIQYNDFVGKTVKWDKFEAPEGSETPVATSGNGKIVSVKYSGAAVEFTLADGTKLNPGNISEVQGAGSSSATSLQDASMLIGKKVTWTKDGKEIESEIIAASKKDGEVVLITANDEKVKLDQLEKIAL